MDLLQDNLNKYKRKYYFNLLLRGLAIMTSLTLAVFLVFNTAEYFIRFNSAVRGFLLFSFVSIALFTMFLWVFLPLSKILKLSKQISDEKAAEFIGQYFADINDKLLNTLQLRKMEQKNDLLLAGIQQKTKELSYFRFPDAIDLSENRKYLRFLLIVLLLGFLGFLLGGLDFFTQPSQRIIRYSENFADKAPFQFYLKNQNLKVFKGENITISLSLKGDALPAEVYLLNAEGKIKMLQKNNAFEYTFQKVQQAEKFSFEAAGYNSNTYEIEVLERPNLLNFSANLIYPAYLAKPAESIKNIGNLVVPEGTQVEWIFKTTQTDSLYLLFEQEKNAIIAEKESEKNFSYKKTLKASQNYTLKLKNQHSENKEAISYFINVIPDQYPKIGMETYQDTTLYAYISVGGSISDDYGLSQLKLLYRVLSTEGKVKTDFKAVNIGVQRASVAQNFYYELDLSHLGLKPGEKVEYFTQVWDNDGVNGAKSAKSQTYQMKLPSEEELRKEIEQNSQKTASSINKTLQKARELKQQINELDEKIKTKRSLDYNDRKQIQDILQKKQELEKDIKQLQELNQNNNDKKDLFEEKQNQEIKEKLEQIEKLMNNLLDEETKKLYEELQKLLEQQKNDPRLQEKIEKLLNKEENLEKELDRTLELYKQMQYEQKFEEIKNDLKKLAEEQKKLAEQTEKANKKDEKNQENLQKEQEKLNEKFEELQKQMQDLEKQNQELEDKNPTLQMQEKQEEVKKEQEKSSENLKSKDNKKAAQNQKKAAEKMQEMEQAMEQMQAESEEEQAEEDLNNLRNILDNLVHLSFDQEDLMKNFRNVSSSDPRFIELAQKQLKLTDDSKIIEDSLTALAKRVPQIESFVMRELSEMQNAMNAASKAIKERKLSIATSKQQTAMATMNNLALMLNNSLQQMQNQMNSKSGKSKGKKGKNSGQNLSQMQKEIAQKMGELKKSGKTGNQLSEELAKLAAQQEALRRRLEELKKGGKMDKNGNNMGDQLGDLIKKMEKNEDDLINKRLSDELIQRQKDIETRLLEYEKAQRERGEDEKRKGETAKPKEKVIPKNLEGYTKPKNKQTEILKGIPPSLNPYYKKEIDKYFEKIGK
ncbi:MAG: DUF4175 family protein [Thermonemataceae bacterium]|nr:DUF4175 family protein [Thermonemataceae bacterium]